MPIVSQFYGIIIRIYFNDSEKHYLEHIHVQYHALWKVAQCDGEIFKIDPLK